MGFWGGVKKGAKAFVQHTPAGRAYEAGKDLSKGNYGDALGHATMGGAYDPLKAGATAAYNKLEDAFNEPHDIAKAANQRAAAKAEGIGREGMDLADKGVSRALDQTMPAARQWHGTYEGDGALAKNGYLEDLYEQRRGGDDPALARQRELGEKSIRDQFAAMGISNSGAALQAGANMNSDIYARKYDKDAQLAGQAQAAKEGRLGGAFDRLHSLGAGRAGIVQSGTQHGIDAYTSGKMAGVQGRLAAAGADTNRARDRNSLGGKILGGLWDLGTGAGG